MSQEERSPSASPNTTQDVSTSCSSSSGYHSDNKHHRNRPPSPSRGKERDPTDDFVVVDLVDGRPHDPPSRRMYRSFSSSLPRVRFHTSDPSEGIDIAMGESGLAAEEPITVGEMVQRTVVRVPHHVALRYKVGQGGGWRDVSYMEYYQQCISAAKAFLKVSSIIAA